MSRTVTGHSMLSVNPQVMAEEFESLIYLTTDYAQAAVAGQNITDQLTILQGWIMLST